ncbi:hypothetical protein GEMRC1_001887 [Eukaryota sp. GEM-RC1]
MNPISQKNPPIVSSVQHGDRPFVPVITHNPMLPLYVHNTENIDLPLIFDLHELLPLTSSLQGKNKPSRSLRFQQSLLILIHIHLLKRVCKSSLEVTHAEPRRAFLRLKRDLPKFFNKVGLLSQYFLESALLAVKSVLKQTCFLFFLKIFLNSVH